MKDNSSAGFNAEREYVDTRIADSPNGYKIIIPVFNAAVPAYFKENALKTVEAFMEAYKLSCGMPLKPENIYADGNLSVCLDRKIPADKKYRLYIVIIIEGRGGEESQDYIIEVPVLPGDAHFAEFRQCFLNEMEAMLGQAEL